MTKNQIEFLKVQETRRANRAQEHLTETRDTRAAQLGLDQLRETARHNQQVELQARDNLAEQYRNNVAQVAELQRSHLASEGLTQLTANMQQENVAAQIASAQKIAQQDVETRRDIAAINAATSQYMSDNSLAASQISAAAQQTAAGINASAARYSSDNALLARQLEIDLNRYGIDVNAGLTAAQQAETHRANVARETETNRANVVSEGIRNFANSETLRHNVVSEGLTEAKQNADISLRTQQNAIAQQNADTQRQVADANISLVPSQKFQNVSSGIGTLARSLDTAINLITTFKGGS